MSKHTPGPWGYVDESPRDVRLKRAHWSVGALEGREGVALVFRDEANAKLIAAAPELLEACQAMVEWFRKEKAGWQKDRSTPEGEAAWRAWWEEQLALCDRSETLAVAAVTKATA